MSSWFETAYKFLLSNPEVWIAALAIVIMAKMIWTNLIAISTSKAAAYVFEVGIVLGGSYLALSALT